MSDVTADPFAPQSEPPPPPRDAPEPVRESALPPLSKIALILGLAIACILPNLLIGNVIDERQQRQESVRDEIKGNWGPQQTVYSPTLVIPYQAGDRPRQYLKLAAAQLDVAASLAPQQRKRGLFQVTVYEARLDMKGTFVVPPEARLRDFVSDKDGGRFVWNEAAIVFGTAEGLAGMRASDNITIDGVETPWQPCLEAVRSEQTCRGSAMVLAAAPLAPTAGGARVAFKTVVNLRGTGSLCFLHGGKDLAATFRSSWDSPSFIGNTLPLSSAITPDGFEAKWQASEFGAPRITASPLVMDSAMWKGPTIGVDLIEATPIYRMITRVSKYGLLFVVLAFATYFFFEVLSRLRIHIVQYGLLGLSLSLFSLLLVSLAEPIGYTNGYLLSAALVLMQSSLYTAAVARRARPALTFALVLASLFGFIYLLLGLETYSLLIGALALFVVVSALMVLTQMVRWPGRAEPAQVAV
ncbi:MAG TPA: cell envelope integrity protein CreD [Xanthobacteraceae bacterium]|nr:cell envelope integrity protein CreD [Xanthobacteraceae bacterium]